MSSHCGKVAEMPHSEPESYELNDSSEPADREYPVEPSLAGDLMRHLADQLLAGRYVDDATLQRIWDHNEAHDIPPIVERYRELRRRGVPWSRMRVNGEKLRKYRTAKRDHRISEVLGNASEITERIPGRVKVAKRELAEILGISVSSVQRRWTDIESDKKRDPGRPLKKKQK